jgi:hypothetical protein
LKEILDDESTEKYNRTHFVLTNYNVDHCVYTFLYLRGTIKKGGLVGKWNFPGPSPTNSVLLWPDTLDFFMEKIGYKKIAY